MKHTIMCPDRFRDGEPRSIVWDDETGEVSGDHSEVPDIRDTMARAERDGFLPEPTGHFVLRDPRHDPGDFLTALLWPGPPASPPDWLPPALRRAYAPKFFAYAIPDDARA